MQATSARLSYVVRKLPGNVERETHKISGKGKGIQIEKKTQPAGYMVYFPRGHCLRMDEAMLKHYGLDKKAGIINAENILADPNSPLARMLTAQTEEARNSAGLDMERAVIQMALAKTGPVVMAEQVQEIK